MFKSNETTMFLVIGYVKHQLSNCNLNAVSQFLSSVFDYFCVSNIIFMCEGLTKFARVHTRSFEGTLGRVKKPLYGQF